MRALLIAVAVLVLLFVAGWLTFSGGDEDASLNVETERIREDTAEMVEGGRQALEDLDEKVDIEIQN